MNIHTAGWGGLSTLFFVLFIVVPSIRWSIWGARWGMRHGPRLGRRYARRWTGEDQDWDNADPNGPTRIQKEDFEALRSELDGRLSEFDSLNSRVAELENRLDFTERLLAQRSEVVPGPDAEATRR